MIDPDDRPLIAFHAPMKPPDHPTPSGDREIARLTMRALEMAGYRVWLASHLRTLDMAGSGDFQRDCMDKATAEVGRITSHGEKPDLWFTYHCYYKAPDLLGPPVAQALGIPYVISEPSVSPRRREGPWAQHARRSEAALALADRLLVTTARDWPAIETFLSAECHRWTPADRMISLPGFLDIGPAVPPRAAAAPLRLLTVAMMRPGDKTESYRRLARALGHLDLAWHLTVIGDGPARAEVSRLFAGQPVTWPGAIDDPIAVRQACQDADLLVWPGVNEGVGMTYLEAQAAGLPVVAEAHSAQRDTVANALAPPDDAAAFARLIADSAANRAALSAQARTKIEARHSLQSAAATLRSVLQPLIERRA